MAGSEGLSAAPGVAPITRDEHAHIVALAHGLHETLSAFLRAATGAPHE